MLSVNNPDKDRLSYQTYQLISYLPVIWLEKTGSHVIIATFTWHFSASNQNLYIENIID